MVTTTTWSMPEFPGFGKVGRAARADVVLLKGLDGASTAAPDAKIRFFTNSRRWIFTDTPKQEIGSVRICNRRSQTRAGIRFYDCRKTVRGVGILSKCRGFPD